MKSHIFTSFSLLSWKINCGHNYSLDVTLKPRHSKDDLKLEQFPSSFPFLPQGWSDGKGEDDIKCEVCVIHIKWIKGESQWI